MISKILVNDRFIQLTPTSDYRFLTNLLVGRNRTVGVTPPNRYRLSWTLDISSETATYEATFVNGQIKFGINRPTDLSPAEFSQEDISRLTQLLAILNESPEFTKELALLQRAEESECVYFQEAWC